MFKNAPLHWGRVVRYIVYFFSYFCIAIAKNLITNHKVYNKNCPTMYFCIKMEVMKIRGFHICQQRKMPFIPDIHLTLSTHTWTVRKREKERGAGQNTEGETEQKKKERE